jgi:hypothetical protein
VGLTVRAVKTGPIEHESLEAHVELCAERYSALEKRISLAEADFEKFRGELDNRKLVNATLWTAILSIPIAVSAVISLFLMK